MMLSMGSYLRGSLEMQDKWVRFPDPISPRICSKSSPFLICKIKTTGAFCVVNHTFSSSYFSREEISVKPKAKEKVELVEA